MSGTTKTTKKSKFMQEQVKKYDIPKFEWEDDKEYLDRIQDVMERDREADKYIGEGDIDTVADFLKDMGLWSPEKGFNEKLFNEIKDCRLRIGYSEDGIDYWNYEEEINLLTIYPM